MSDKVLKLNILKIWSTGDEEQLQVSGVTILMLKEQHVILQ